MGVDGGDGVVEAKAVGKTKTRAGEAQGSRWCRRPRGSSRFPRRRQARKPYADQTPAQDHQNVPVGKVQTKLKLRKGAMVLKGIKVTNADSRNKILAELKAEVAKGTE